MHKKETPPPKSYKWPLSGEWPTNWTKNWSFNIFAHSWDLRRTRYAGMIFMFVDDAVENLIYYCVLYIDTKSDWCWYFIGRYIVSYNTEMNYVWVSNHILWNIAGHLKNNGLMENVRQSLELDHSLRTEELSKKKVSIWTGWTGGFLRFSTSAFSRNLDSLHIP